MIDDFSIWRCSWLKCLLESDLLFYAAKGLLAAKSLLKIWPTWWTFDADVIDLLSSLLTKELCFAGIYPQRMIWILTACGCLVVCLPSGMARLCLRSSIELFVWAKLSSLPRRLRWAMSILTMRSKARSILTMRPKLDFEVYSSTWMLCQNWRLLVRRLGVGLHEYVLAEHKRIFPRTWYKMALLTCRLDSHGCEITALLAGNDTNLLVLACQRQLPETF